MSSRKVYKRDNSEHKYSSASTPSTPGREKLKYTENDPRKPNTIEFNNEISKKLTQASQKNKVLRSTTEGGFCVEEYLPSTLDIASYNLNAMNKNATSEIANYYLPKTAFPSEKNSLLPKKAAQEAAISEDKSPNAQTDHHRLPSKDKVTTSQIYKEKSLAESKSPNIKENEVYSPIVYFLNKEIKTTPKTSLPSFEYDQATYSQPVSVKKNIETNKKKNVNQNLLEATKKGKIVDVQKWLQAGADIDTQEISSGNTPYFLAINNKHLEIALFLKRAGANCSKLNSTGNDSVDKLGNYLITAVKENKAKDIDLLLELDAPVNYQEPDTKNTALHFAMIKKDYACAIKLLENGATHNLLDLNDKDRLLFVALSQTVKILTQELVNKASLISEKSEQHSNSIAQLKQQQEHNLKTTELYQFKDLADSVKDLTEKVRLFHEATKTMLVRFIEVHKQNVALEQTIGELQKTMQEISKTLIITERHNKKLDIENKKLYDLVQSIINNKLSKKLANKPDKIEEDSEEFITDSEEGSAIQTREQVIAHSGNNNLQYVQELGNGNENAVNIIDFAT